jgi:hypothetical protein
MNNQGNNNQYRGDGRSPDRQNTDGQEQYDEDPNQ